MNCLNNKKFILLKKIKTTVEFSHRIQKLSFKQETQLINNVLVLHF